MGEWKWVARAKIPFGKWATVAYNWFDTVALTLHNRATASPVAFNWFDTVALTLRNRATASPVAFNWFDPVALILCCSV